MDSKATISLLFIALVMCFSRESLELSPKRKRNLGSKTRYYSRNISFEIPNLCEPLHITMLLRHGTRHPSKKDVNKIDEMLKVVEEEIKINGSLTRVGNLLLPWESPFSHAYDKLLTTEGEEEMYQIAKRMLNRFRKLLSRPYLTTQFDFISSGTTRTLQSAMAFAYGLFEGSGRLGKCNFKPIAVKSSNIDNDPLLRFFDLCPKYLKGVANNKSALSEYHTFKRGSEMKKVLHKVSQKLNMSFNSLSEKTVLGMYKACIFEVAVYDRDNTWCELFDEQDMQVLEYLCDLKHYWKRGYGHQITRENGCPLLAHIISSIKNATTVDGEVDRKHGSFMFGHAETLQPVYGLLGLFKDDEDLRSDNFHIQHGRKYRTSYIVPFGANIAFVVYKCGLAESTSQGSCSSHAFKVQVFVNEELVTLPCCGTQAACPLDVFLQCFDEDGNLSCHLPSLCSVDGGSSQADVPDSHYEL